MKKFFSLAFLGLLLSLGVNAQTARVQVIHNSADAAASTVDVWLTAGPAPAVKLLEDFDFRTATPFIDAPAGIPLQIGVAPGTSTSVTDTIANFNLTLMANAKYVVVANGIVSASGYMPATPFGLDIYALGREEASTAGNTDVLVHHGSTDAPAVDVVEVDLTGGARIVNDAAFGDFSNYLELGNADYDLQVRTANCDITVAEFDAVLATLGLMDSAAVVVASGFLDPSMNSNGPAFGLYVALPGGGSLVQVPTKAISTSRVQVIHNSADLAAGTVDVWLNDGLLLDDFDFRTASPFIDAPAGTAFDVSIAGPTSTDTIGALAKYTYTLMGGEKYILVANGQVSTTGYSPATPFDIDVFAGARECAETAGNTSVMVYHGATDAPTVDVVETSIPAGVLVDNASYTDFAGYLDLGNADYELAIQDENNTVTVASYQAPLQTLGLADSAIAVLASGFLDPSMNSMGDAFGLYVALPSGGPLVMLPVITSIEEGLNGIDFTVFPNPTSDMLNVTFDAPAAGEAAISIQDLNGRTVKMQDFGTVGSGLQNLNINVSDVPAGLYLMDIRQGNSRMASKVQIIR